MNKAAMTIQAPAKVNLTLRILGKRRDGFHDVETLMAPISLSDQIDISISDGTGLELICSDPTLPSNETNLAWRAARAFAAHTERKFHAKIKLKKNIPSGAGLGGGSSDAAAVILALNDLLSTNLNISEMESIARELGSDVPFFIRRRASLCHGRGDQMENATSIPERTILCVKPPFPVSTAWAYQVLSLSSPSTSKENQTLGSVKLVNDLESPAFKKYILLPVIKNWLCKQSEVESAMMSGSGSTIFAILHEASNSLPQKIQSQFGPCMWTHLCKLLNTY